MMTRVSAKGQVVIPKDVRDELGWLQGTELEVIKGPTQVVLRPKQKPFDQAEFDLKLAKLRATANYHGPVYSDEEVNAAIGEMFASDSQWWPPNR